MADAEFSESNNNGNAPSVADKHPKQPGTSSSDSACAASGEASTAAKKEGDGSFSPMDKVIIGFSLFFVLLAWAAFFQGYFSAGIVALVQIVLCLGSFGLHRAKPKGVFSHARGLALFLALCLMVPYSASLPANTSEEDVKVESEESALVDGSGSQESAGSEAISAEEPAQFPVRLNVDCSKNMFFSTYNVELYVDSSKMGDLVHGTQGVFELSLTQGDHVFRVQKTGDAAVFGEVQFVVEAPSSFGITLSCLSESIDVEIEPTEYEDETRQTGSYESIGEGNAVAPVDSTDSRSFEEVVAAFQTAGFSNVSAVPVYDIIVGRWFQSSPGETESIVVGDVAEFSAGDSFSKDSPVVITYHLTDALDPSIVYTPCTVDQLVATLENNALNAKNNLEEGYVEVTGTLGTIDANGKYIYLDCLNNPWSFTSVRCEIEDETLLQHVATLSSGSTVTVRGRITTVGEVVGFVMYLYSFC